MKNKDGCHNDIPLCQFVMITRVLIKIEYISATGFVTEPVHLRAHAHTPVVYPSDVP